MAGLTERSGSQALSAAEAAFFFTEVTSKLASQLLQFCDHQPLMEVHTHLHSSVAANNIALIDALQQLLFNVSAANILRRDSVLAGADSRIPAQLLDDLRASPFLNQERYVCGRHT